MAATLKFTVGTDTLTGKKIKYTNDVIYVRNGSPYEFIGTISLHEVNDSPATPPDNTDRGKKVVQSYTDNFQTNGKFIDSVTKLYLPGLIDTTDPENPVPYPNAVSLDDYFSNKVINTYPGVGGGDPTWKGSEGWCKEMFNIRIANGEFVV